MSVREYKKGEHPRGFVGFRVVRVVKSYRQRYFSTNHYERHVAHKLAHELDDKWREEQEQIKYLNQTRSTRKRAGENVIATGLRAYISIDMRKNRENKIHFNPCFIVDKKGGGAYTFNTEAYGFTAAYTNAVNRYCQIHELDSSQRDILLRRKPSKEIFTVYLLNRIKARGIEIDETRLHEKLVEKLSTYTQ